MRLYGRTCNIPVTAELKELSDNSLINEKEGVPYLPQGYYFISDGSYFTDSESKILINCADLVNCVNHPDGKRLNGCCGLDGLDGPNKVCMNGHEIATEKSDCWIANAVVLENSAVNTIPD